MIKIGITGGIGSGKSVIASLLNLYGIPVYVADTESKILTETSPAIKEKLTALFGDDLYTDKGLNKKLLASHIFNNHFSAWTKAQASPICAIESAILFESGFNKVVDKSLMVYAPREIRIERAVSRDNTAREEIIRRIENQLPDETKRDWSDYVIYNDDKQALLPQVEKFLASL